MAYFANGSEGEVLDAQCADCPLGFGWNDPDQKELFDRERWPRPCPVAFVQMTYNYDQCDVPKLQEAMNILIDKRGTCKVREQLVEIRAESSGS